MSREKNENSLDNGASVTPAPTSTTTNSGVQILEKEQFRLEYTDTWMKVTLNGRTIHDGPTDEAVRNIFIKNFMSYKKAMDDIEQNFERQVKKNEKTISCGCCLITGIILMLVGGIIVCGLGWGAITMFDFIKSLF